jgi:hypothetical protein
LLSAKDNRILELSEQVAELGRKVFDLEENLREKDEVIAARSASAPPPVFRPMLRILDFWSGSGFGSGSCYSRHKLSRHQQKTNIKKFFAY